MVKKTTMGSDLKPLLIRFVEENLLTPDILRSVRKYLFEDDLSIPFFRNSELFETAVYLKDLMHVNQLNSVGDILYYFEKKKKSISVFIDHAIEAQCHENESKLVEGDDESQISIVCQTNNICITYLEERCMPFFDFPPRISNTSFCSFVPNISDQEEMYNKRGQENEHEKEYSNA
jgi:hypothetical protein